MSCILYRLSKFTTSVVGLFPWPVALLPSKCVNMELCLYSHLLGLTRLLGWVWGLPKTDVETVDVQEIDWGDRQWDKRGGAREGMENLQTRMQAPPLWRREGKEGCIGRVSHYGTVISVPETVEETSLWIQSSKADRGIREDSRALDVLLKKATVFLILI